MKGAFKAARVGALVMGAAVFASAAFAQKGSTVDPSRDQVRIRILDTCVMTQSGKLAEEGAGPKCNCYAAKIVKALTDEEVTKYKALPNRLTEESNKIFAGCK